MRLANTDCDLNMNTSTIEHIRLRRAGGGVGDRRRGGSPNTQTRTFPSNWPLSMWAIAFSASERLAYSIYETPRLLCTINEKR
jgi:hypothetical protein